MMSVIPSPAYMLCEHVFACLRESSVVLLDLRRDRYFQIDAPEVLQLGDAIARWPQNRNETTYQDCPRIVGAQSLVANLLEMKLIEIFDQHAMPSFDAQGFCTPQREVVGTPGGTRAPIGVADLYDFASASLTAAFRLKFWPLQKIVTSIAARRDGLESQAVQSASVDFSKLEITIQKYSQIQPSFWKTKDRCLVESLRLSAFLARRGFFPAWIFGVSINPFAAHCWLQIEDAVLNEPLDMAASCTPIMAVSASSLPKI